jgi:hypothetical protein
MFFSRARYATLDLVGKTAKGSVRVRVSVFLLDLIFSSSKRVWAEK